jgi:hypothetical protein
MSLTVPFSGAAVFLLSHSFQSHTEQQKHDPHPAAGASLDTVEVVL